MNALVGAVHSWTKATEVSFSWFYIASISWTGNVTKVYNWSPRRNTSSNLGQYTDILGRNLCPEGLCKGECKFSDNNWNICSSVLVFEVVLNALCSFQNIRRSMWYGCWERIGYWQKKKGLETSLGGPESNRCICEEVCIRWKGGRQLEFSSSVESYRTS